MLGDLFGFLLARRRLKKLLKRFPGLSLEPDVRIKGVLSNLEVEGSVSVQSGTVLHLGGYGWCEHAGNLSIRDGATISPNCTIYGCGPGGVRIGRNFDCGPGVVIVASRTDFEQNRGGHVFAPVVIGDDVILYANAVIGPGVAIGDRAVVAAGSVVTKDVPPDCLVGGAPARVIRSLD